jgi:hypothetical protein
MGDASGFMGTPEEYIEGYVGEVQFLNRTVQDALDDLLASAKPPFIVIIQGDHGPGNYFDMTRLDESCLRERYSIFNAYYFSSQDYSALYPAISPVNSFRAVFNTYFNAGLPMLEDRSYYSTWAAPYVFTEVSDKIGQTCRAPIDG